MTLDRPPMSFDIFLLRRPSLYSVFRFQYVPNLGRNFYEVHMGNTLKVTRITTLESYFAGKYPTAVASAVHRTLMSPKLGLPAPSA